MATAPIQYVVSTASDNSASYAGTHGPADANKTGEYQKNPGIKLILPFFIAPRKDQFRQ